MIPDLQILILDDNYSDIESIEQELTRGEFEFKTKVVETESTFKEALVSFKPNLILSGFSPKKYNGMLALKYIKENFPYLPFILVTNSSNEEIAVDCIKAGADDYILKDNLKRLNHSIKTAIRSKKDRTDARAAVDALKESEERYRGFFNLSPDGIIVHKDGIITFANQSAAELIGYSFAYELVGLKAASFVHPDYLQVVQSRISKLLSAEKKLPPAEEKFICKDGSIIDVETIACKYSFGDENSILVIVRDITERKAIENELMAAKDKAEKSNSFKANLLSNLSHEFRTPINGILGFAQILKDELESDDQVKMLNNIIKSSKRLIHTLTSILYLSQIEADKLSAKVQAENAGDLILYASKFFEEEFKCKSLEFKVTIKDSELYLNIDEELFKVIISNLISNSLKFTLKGSVEITAERTTDMNNKQWALIEVKDTGIGIAVDKQELIFEPFKQVSEGSSRGYEGNGLGLTIAKKMIDLLDGGISLESELGKGSIFKIYFPLIEGSPEGKLAAPMKTDTAKTPSNENKPLEILLVEDNYINKEVTFLYLKDIHKIDHAPNGEKAVSMAKSKKYEAILMDINLGIGIDGIQTMKRIRKIKGYEKVPVVALTGYTLRADKEKFVSEGFTHFLSKPFEKYDLLDVIEEIIG